MDYIRTGTGGISEEYKTSSEAVPSRCTTNAQKQVLSAGNQEVALTDSGGLTNPMVLNVQIPTSRTSFIVSSLDRWLE